MFRLILWGLIIYIIYRLVKFFNKVYNAINNAAFRDTTMNTKNENISSKKDPNNIIEADFTEIKTKDEDSVKQDETK